MEFSAGRVSVDPKGGKRHEQRKGTAAFHGPREGGDSPVCRQAGREHLIERVPISEVCEKHGLQPTVFYQWQKKLFEDGGLVFEQPRGKSPR
jgi:hypothetical protein